jgi:hypothetical protein
MGWFDRIRRRLHREGEPEWTHLSVDVAEFFERLDREYRQADTSRTAYGLPQVLQPREVTSPRVDVGTVMAAYGHLVAAATKTRPVSPRPDDVEDWGSAWTELREVAERLGRALLREPYARTLVHTVELTFGVDRVESFELTAFREDGAVMVRADRDQGLLWSTDPFRPVGSGTLVPSLRVWEILDAEFGSLGPPAHRIVYQGPIRYPARLDAYSYAAACGLPVSRVASPFHINVS